MWCAGKLGGCNIGEATEIMQANPDELKRFHLTCLYCRWRRSYLGKYVKPAYWIKYTYLNHSVTYRTKTHRCNGKIYTLSNGGYLMVQMYFTLHIDPRGHFTRLRCAAIVTLDKMVKLFHCKKPFVEIAELLSNYPVW